MDSIVYNTPMALQFVPILFSVLLSIVGMTMLVIGFGWTSSEPSRGIAVAGACLALLSLPASRMTAASSGILLVLAAFTAIFASLAMIVSLSLLAYSR